MRNNVWTPRNHHVYIGNAMRDPGLSRARISGQDIYGQAITRTAADWLTTDITDVEVRLEQLVRRERFERE